MGVATRCISRKCVGQAKGEFYIEPVMALYPVLKLGSKQNNTNAHDRRYDVVFMRCYDNRT